jgi:CheY-like chemotaxis protein
MNAGSKYDLVLMDIIMPNLDGVSACHLIRQFDTTPIVAMTSNIRSDDISMYFQHGMCSRACLQTSINISPRYERCTSQAIHERRSLAHVGETPGPSEEAHGANRWHGCTTTRASPSSACAKGGGRLASQIACDRKQLELAQQSPRSVTRG